MGDPREALRGDHRSGASELVGQAERAIRAALDEHGPGPAALVPALRRVCRAQPAMASILRLAAEALVSARAAERAGAPPAEAAAAVRSRCAAFATEFEADAERVVERAAETIPRAGWVATFSRSSLVERTLLRAAERGRGPRVLLAEGRPLYEGRTLAAQLAAAGIPCWLTTDSAAALLLPRAQLLLVGADAVRPKSFLNKVGTHAYLLAAREQSLEVYLLAPSGKLVPGETALLDLDERSPEEVWDEAPAGVSVRNPTFEEIPLGLVRGVITERGVLAPGEVAVRAGEVPVPEELCRPWGALPGEGIAREGTDSDPAESV